jgi:hypothetical protein
MHVGIRRWLDEKAWLGLIVTRVVAVAIRLRFIRLGTQTGMIHAQLRKALRAIRSVLVRELDRGVDKITLHYITFDCRIHHLQKIVRGQGGGFIA